MCFSACPGVMVFLGVCPEGQQWQSACPCHSNKMVLDEAMLARGVAAHCAIAERFSFPRVRVTRRLAPSADAARAGTRCHVRQTRFIRDAILVRAWGASASV
jgi:hypothetical protein